MVTAEVAVALPAVVALLGGLLALVAAVSAQMRCIDAAREGARSAARGDPSGYVVAIATRAAPSGASVAVSLGGEYATVTVSAQAEVLGGAASIAVSATATSRVEPDSGDLVDPVAVGLSGEGPIQEATRGSPAP